MRRGDKHAPWVDEALAHDVEPLERGAPVEPRVEEFREQEPAGDDEPVTTSRWWTRGWRAAAWRARWMPMSWRPLPVSNLRLAIAKLSSILPRHSYASVAARWSRLTTPISMTGSTSAWSSRPAGTRVARGAAEKAAAIATRSASSSSTTRRRRRRRSWRRGTPSPIPMSRRCPARSPTSRPRASPRCSSTGSRAGRPSPRPCSGTRSSGSGASGGQLLQPAARLAQ